MAHNFHKLALAFDAKRAPSHSNSPRVACFQTSHTSNNKQGSGRGHCNFHVAVQSKRSWCNTAKPFQQEAVSGIACPCSTHAAVHPSLSMRTGLYATWGIYMARNKNTWSRNLLANARPRNATLPRPALLLLRSHVAEVLDCAATLVSCGRDTI